MDLSTLLYIVYAILGLGVIIFIHELGHFVAAKKAGVRVDRFSIGFDPPLFGRNLRLYSTTIGETEYVIGLVPLGGYVKMAGETHLATEEGGEGSDTARGGAPPKDWLIAKPTSSRAVVFAAGAIFNIISAIFFFAIAFLIGVKFVQPTVGSVEVGMPAWEQGLRAGDEILSIDGKEIKAFDEVPMAAALRDGEPLMLKVQRGDETHEIEVTPIYRSERGLKEIGISPAIDWRVAKVDRESPAAGAGIETDDRVVGFRQRDVEFANLPTMNLLLGVINQYTSYAPDRPFDLLVEGEGWKTIQPQKDADTKGRALLGVAPHQTLVIRGLAPGSEASRVFKKGDRILTVNGEPFVRLSGPKLVAAHPNPDASLELEIEAADGSTSKSSIRRDDLLAWTTAGHIHFDERGARIGVLKPGVPLYALGLRSGDIVEKVGATALVKPDDFDLETLLSKQDPPRAKTETLAFSIIRDGFRIAEPVEVPVELLTSADTLPWDFRPRLFVVGAEVPAARLGIEDGSTIVRIGATEIQNWDQLTKAVKSAEKGKEIEVAWITPNGEARDGRSELFVDVYKPLGLSNRRTELTLQTANPLVAVQFGLERTVIVAKRVYLTLRALFKKEGVSVKLLSGPLGIVHIMVLVSEMGIGKLIYFLAMISINLGIFNLLPFPILDGGHLMFLLIEKIKGSPVSIRVQEIATTVAFFLLISLVIFVTYNDILRLVRLS